MSRVALVTGGSGAVGSAIVRTLRRDGLSVAFTFNTHKDRAEALAKETGALPFQANLLDARAVKAMVAQVQEKVGPIDILVNNAGATQVMPFALIEEEDWDETINSNLKTMYLVTHEVVRDMIRRKTGTIVNMGSLGGRRLIEVPVHYAAAKAAVTGFTISLAKELSRYRIRVNEVSPGMLDGGVAKQVPEKQLAEYCQYNATGRPGTTQEAAEAVAFLVSDRASYINAQTLCVDGGI